MLDDTRLKARSGGNGGGRRRRGHGTRCARLGRVIDALELVSLLPGLLLAGSIAVARLATATAAELGAERTAGLAEHRRGTSDRP